MKYAVEMKGVTKKFPKVIANNDIDFSVLKGEIHALVGENGAGKTTLMNILYGLYMPTAGEIFLEGEKVRIGNALDAIKQGIGMVHQHFMLIPRLSVAENVVLGDEPKKKFFMNKGKAEKNVQEICDKYGLKVDVKATVSEISLGMKQRVEIIKCLYRGAEVIILDEPTAVLTPQEIDELGEILKELKSLNKTVIIITHKISEILNFSDRVTVLRHGVKVGTVVTEETDEQEITRMMVGKDIVMGGNKEESKFTDNILELKDVNYKNKLKDISLQLRKGEILGISGIDGSGQTELAEVISGCRIPQSGRVIYDGEDITSLPIRDRKDAGIAFVPQDRHKNGLVLDFSIEENLLLGRQNEERFKNKNGSLNQNAIKEDAKRKIEKFDIRTPSEMQAANTLSGGNQQKVIIAREVGGSPKLIVADQPTRGIDIGAIEFIYDIITEQRNKGCGVLLVSLELDEIMTVSDRIIVMNEGRIAGIVDPRKTTREEIGLLMVGEHKV